MTAPNLPLIGRDTAYVVWILRHEVGIEINKRLAHLARMLLINTKDDGLREAVGRFEKLRQVVCNRFRSRAESNNALEVFRLIFIVWDRAAVAVPRPTV